MTLLRTLARRPGAAPPAGTPRWVVLDVESSGLDPSTDRLLAIAAIAVRTDGPRPRIALGDSFEVVLRNSALVADKGNILLHGIGLGAQRRGADPARALGEFMHYIGASPLIAFHAAFDRALLLRACDDAAVPRPANPWLDLEPLAAVLHPQSGARSLDEWLAQMQIHCAVRHQAAADALATAELLLKLWPAASAEMGATAGFAAAQKIAARRKWLAT